MQPINTTQLDSVIVNGHEVQIYVLVYVDDTFNYDELEQSDLERIEAGDLGAYVVQVQAWYAGCHGFDVVGGVFMDQPGQELPVVDQYDMVQTAVDDLLEAAHELTKLVG